MLVGTHFFTPIVVFLAATHCIAIVAKGVVFGKEGKVRRSRIATSVALPVLDHQSIRRSCFRSRSQVLPKGNASGLGPTHDPLSSRHTSIQQKNRDQRYLLDFFYFVYIFSCSRCSRALAPWLHQWRLQSPRGHCHCHCRCRCRCQCQSRSRSLCRRRSDSLSHVGSTHVFIVLLVGAHHGSLQSMNNHGIPALYYFNDYPRDNLPAFGRR